MASPDWLQIGTDFAQKYDGTFCRYVSPITRRKEVFQIIEVVPQEDTGPEMRLHNERAGELYLTYTGEAELDFTFPETRNFQCGNRVLVFYRNHERQWKKGICSGTASVFFPYNTIDPAAHPRLSCEVLEDAFATLPKSNLSDALERIDRERILSVALNDKFSVGVGNEDRDRWLWFQSALIAEVTADSVKLKVKDFTQEVKDFLRDTNDRRRVV